MNAVVPFQPAVEAYGARSLTAADVRAQVNLMQDVMAEVMRDGTHYGTIPGTKSKSLYKAGAEKLMATFRLAARPEVEDLSANGEIAYRVTVNLLSANGSFIGAGIGECSSAEDKYSWRAAICDEEFEATPENRRRLKFSKYQGKVEKKKQVRTNPADVANTILKMAKKRAQVDAVITATAASDIFTQDIEDLPEEVVAEIVGRTPPREVVARQAPAVVDSPERDQLYVSLQDIATAGLKAYGEAWAKLTKEQRTMIGQAAHELLKGQAEKADAEVVE
ncbi:hypothetical protein [Xanthomonas arboricola]|uniref:hypothetical protein n=1 Tax=Xanthomonas arboricola TaxID=56448 RepID=UPI0014317C27|nr:hypothetical protein [Xanthomonas arboricola]NJB80341.1 head-tail adaptor [Xanthomonas arboricola]